MFVCVSVLPWLKWAILPPRLSVIRVRGPNGSWAKLKAVNGESEKLVSGSVAPRPSRMRLYSEIERVTSGKSRVAAAGARKPVCSMRISVKGAKCPDLIGVCCRLKGDVLAVIAGAGIHHDDFIDDITNRGERAGEGGGFVFDDQGQRRAKEHDVKLREYHVRYWLYCLMSATLL